MLITQCLQFCYIRLYKSIALFSKKVLDAVSTQCDYIVIAASKLPNNKRVTIMTALKTKTKQFKTIKSYISLYGGWAFRATSNGEVVHLQQRSPMSSYFRTAAKMSFDDFEEWAEKSGAYASYGNADNPGSMSDLISSLTERY